MDLDALRELDDFSFALSTRDQHGHGHREYFQYYGIDFPDIEHRFGALDCKGYRIACHYFAPADPEGTVFLIHGYLDHVGLFKHLISFSLQQGFAVFAFDLPGHGLSSGETAVIHDFQEYVAVFAAIIEQTGADLAKPWHLVAQSTGGAVSMDYLLSSHNNPFASVTLLAPLVRAAHWHWIVMQYNVIKSFVKKVPRKFRANSNDHEFVEFLSEREPLQAHFLSVEWVGALKRWIPRFLSFAQKDIPLLIVQGTADATVDWRYNIKQIKKKFTSVEVIMLDGARHHLANETENYRQHIYAALQRQWQQ